MTVQLGGKVSKQVIMCVCVEVVMGSELKRKDSILVVC